jgi:hypothetical protein
LNKIDEENNKLEKKKKKNLKYIFERKLNFLQKLI